jgi:L-ascorbate metabolism protein UlaG (beta-lactamase superfamily)
MRLTKFTHACVRLEDGDRILVIDPGTFSECDIALAGADAVLVTHEHADHIDVEALRGAAEAQPGLQIWAPSSVTGQLGDLGSRVATVGPGDSFDAAGFAVQTFGGQHALIHPTIPVVANVGYLVSEAVYHPGDSFVVPDRPVDTLLLPLHAPWSKTAEVVDFLVSVRATRAVQVHDALLNDTGRAGVEAQVTRFADRYGTEFRHLDPLASIDL